MYCRMIRGVYLRSNGEMACYCGPGEEVVLGQLPLEGRLDFVQGFYRNPGHENVRRSMSRDVLPYPGVCLKCIYLEPHLPHGLELADREIEWMHLEATSQCNLDCHFCIPRAERRTYRKEPFFLPEDLYAAMVEDIRAQGLTVKWMYFSGRGEPGLHPGLWRMVALAKERLDTNFLVNSNGNIAFSPLIVESGLDKIKIAIDGPDQESYGAYRRGGQVAKVLELTRAISRHKAATGRANPRVIWQYILFGHNDTDAHLARIQELALECGVDEILFKSTFTHNYSARGLDQVPRVHPNLRFLDIKAMVSPDIPELGARLERISAMAADGAHAALIPHAVDLAKNVYRAFILGIERKQLYNRYGSGDDLAMMRDLAGQHGTEYGALLPLLPPAFAALAEAYRATGRPEAAAWYQRSLERFSRVRP